MIQALEIKPVINVKIKLKIDNVNALLTRNWTITQIAQEHNVTPSAVTHFIQRNSNQIITDTTGHNSLLIAKANRIVNNGWDKINSIIEVNGFDKKDLIGLSTTTGTVFDKLRLLKGETTQNVSIDTVNRTRLEVQARIKEIHEDKVKRSGNVGHVGV